MGGMFLADMNNQVNGVSYGLYRARPQEAHANAVAGKLVEVLEKGGFFK